MTESSVFFVSGALGFIGRRVCKQLVKAGHSVNVLVRRNDLELARLGAKIWLGDLRNESLLSEAIAGVNVVIHCAGDARFGNGPQFQKANAELTGKLLEAVKQHAIECSRFIYISSIGAIDRESQDGCSHPLDEQSQAFPTSDYGKSKLDAEYLVKSSGLPISIIRPTLVVGADMRFDSHFAVFARQALSGALVARIAWPGKFSVVHVSDLARAIIFVATHSAASGKTYFCAGEEITIADFFKLCDSEKSRIWFSFISFFASRFPRLLPFSLKAMVLPALTASDLELRALGWQPEYSANTALKEVIYREKFRLDPNLSPGGQTVITGAASGLGREFVNYLVNRRDRILLIDKDRTGLLALAAEFKNCVTCVVDLSSHSEIDELLNSDKWNAFDVCELYACAGIGFRGLMNDVSIDAHRDMVAVNVLSRIALAMVAMDSMQKHHFGRIVMISSSSAFQPLPYMATYAATNGALLSIGESWGAEVAKEGVQIMTVCPGGMQTNFQRNSGVKEIEGERLMKPEVVVEKTMLGLRKQKKTLIVSFRSQAMAMLARVLPRNLSVLLWYRLMRKMR